MNFNCSRLTKSVCMDLCDNAPDLPCRDGKDSLLPKGTTVFNGWSTAGHSLWHGPFSFLIRILQLCDHKTSQNARIMVEMGSHLTKRAPIQSHKSFLDRKSQKFPKVSRQMETAPRKQVEAINPKQPKQWPAAVDIPVGQKAFCASQPTATLAGYQIVQIERHLRSSPKSSGEDLVWKFLTGRFQYQTIHT